MSETQAGDAFRTFSIESPHQVRTMRKHLKERHERVTVGVLEGFAVDYADYKYRIGQLRGIESALQVCDEMEKQENE